MGSLIQLALQVVGNRDCACDYHGMTNRKVKVRYGMLAHMLSLYLAMYFFSTATNAVKVCLHVRVES